MKFYFEFEIVETLLILFFWTQSVGKVRRHDTNTKISCL